MAKVQQTVRAVHKSEGIKIATAKKIEILQKIENTSQAKTKMILAQEFNLPNVHFEKERHHKVDPYRATCQFKDPVTQKTCRHQKFLQVDHIQPRWAGGTNEPSNLQVLCAQHNRYRYKIQAGLLPIS